MKNKIIKRVGKNEIIDQRRLETDFKTLIPSIKPGMNVLDVGCGTGTITSGIAKLVGNTGSVTGIDHTANFIAEGKLAFAEIKNLTLIEADIFSFKSAQKFDLIIAARVLQWLSLPTEALEKMKSLLKPGGQISVLDYNHTAIEFRPEPPKSMQEFYATWLKWRSDAGMDNAISESLPNYFKKAGLLNIQTENANEIYTKTHPYFEDKLNIWAKVASSDQLIEEGYISLQQRKLVISEYKKWIKNAAVSMTLKLKEVKGYINPIY